MVERKELEFARLVGRVVRQHKNLNSLRRFRLHFGVSHPDQEENPVSGFGTELVFGCKVEEIDVKLVSVLGQIGVSRQLPESFYTLKNLKVVKLDGVIKWELLLDVNDIQLPAFPNLTHLTIEISQCHRLILHPLLHSAPKLKSLVAELVVLEDDEEERMDPIPWEETEPTCTPECLLSTLEETRSDICSMLL